MKFVFFALVVLTGCAGNKGNQAVAPTKIAAIASHNVMAVVGAVTAQDALVLNVTHICSGLSAELENQSQESRHKWEQRNKAYSDAFAKFWGDVAVNEYESKGSAAADGLFLAIENYSKSTAAKFINATIYSDPEPIKACGVVLAMINDGVSDIRNIKQYQSEIESILYYNH